MRFPKFFSFVILLLIFIAWDSATFAGPIIIGGGGSSGSNKALKFGALVQAPDSGVFTPPNDLDYRIKTYKQLGLKYARNSISNVAYYHGQQNLGGLQRYNREGIKVELNVNNEDINCISYTCVCPTLGLSCPPSDINAYKTQLRDLFDNFKPDLAVIENEPTVSIFYEGTAAEYFTQLTAACDVAHEYGIKCADGGFTTAEYHTYIDYKRRGLDASALDFARRAGFGNSVINNLNNYILTGTGNQQVSDGEYLLNAYKTGNTDYVNFHWYLTDAKALEETVSFLKRYTGKPVITNEIGQKNNTNVSQVRDMTQKAYNLKMPYYFWFSGDSTTGAQAKALQNDDTSLRPNGIWYRDFIKANGL